MSEQLALFGPPPDPVRALMNRAGVEFALGHGMWSTGGSGCVAPLVRGMPGWRRLCHIYSCLLYRARGGLVDEPEEQAA